MGKQVDKEAEKTAKGAAKENVNEPAAIRRTLVIAQVLTGPEGKMALVYDKLTRYIGWVDMTESEAFFEGRRVFKHVPAKVDSLKPHRKGQQVANVSASIW